MDVKFSAGDLFVYKGKTPPLRANKGYYIVKMYDNYLEGKVRIRSLDESYEYDTNGYELYRLLDQKETWQYFPVL